MITLIGLIMFLAGLADIAGVVDPVPGPWTYALAVAVAGVAIVATHDPDRTR